MRAQRIRTAVQACQTCVRECAAALEHDPSYTRPGIEPFEERQLALVACGSTCAIMADALRTGSADEGLVAWCIETCRHCADVVDACTPQWLQVLGACLACIDACGALLPAQAAREAAA